MARLVVYQEKITNMEELMALCPFEAMENVNGKLEINSACKMCKICVKQGPKDAILFIEDEVKEVDKSAWKGIAVYVEYDDGDIHPVTFELIGKAKELAKKINQPVYCLFMGNDVKNKAETLLYYGVDKVFLYDNENLKNFRIEPYTAVFQDFIEKIKPCVILVGATTIGRSLAPRVSARFRTGLTADCTVLDIKENTDLIQIRPAFGGNIMAQIKTPNHRPQLATVRYKVMNSPEKSDKKTGEIVHCTIESEKLSSNIKVLNRVQKKLEKGISEAEVIIAAGRGVKSEKDLNMIKELAKILGGEIATTRPLIESGWIDAKRQVGLSGRTVRPKLIITCGISGSVQFVAGMSNSDCIISINTDKNAPIFKVAHYAIVGDIYDVIPKLVENLKKLNIAFPLFTSHYKL